MPIVQSGSINTTALLVPDAYIVVQPPAASALNGVPSNVAGIVGTASWGPVNSPAVVGNPAQYAALFGPVMARANDLGTAVSIASQQGANNFRCVRVTDGTDTAATVEILTNCLSITSKYTGSFGNGTVATISPGSQAGTYKVVLAIPGLVPEAFDNIGSGLSGNALWVAIAAAINNGTTALRGPSNLCVAAAGAGGTPPASATYALSGGTDGVTSITTSVLIGNAASTPRTGMYALTGTGVSVAMLADLSDSTSWATQIAWALANGVYMILTLPAGESIAAAVAAKSGAGINSYAAKLLHGDWVYWLDTYNSLTRLVSPQSFLLGLLANLAPNQSSLNKPLQGVVGTQTSYANQVYAAADLQTLAGAQIDVITNPCPGGAYFGARIGLNTSSNPLINGDNYTRMTNYIAATLNAGMGQFVGQPQAANNIGGQGTPSANAAATLTAFCENLQAQGLIGSPSGPVAYAVQVSAANNPSSQVALGYLQANVAIQYQSIVQFFLVNTQGGQSVTIPTSTAVAT